ncbi:MAG: hypothetical protein ACLQVY_30080 [Limisphaerales bacterium]
MLDQPNNKSWPPDESPQVGPTNRPPVQAGATVLLALTLLTSCDAWPPSSLKVPPISKTAYQEYKLEIDDKKNVQQPACVVIQGQDIQLPLSAGNLRPQENRLYSFYIWAYEAGSADTLKEQWFNGAFRLEVIGVDAEIDAPKYIVKGPPKEFLPAATNSLGVAAMESRDVLEVKVRSQDITGPFSIVAWYPDKFSKFVQDNYANYHTNAGPGGIDDKPANIKNPWGVRREVMVYNGDLRTHIEMADEREAESSFGKSFTKFFYVGRIYLRNRHPDKRMVVYTTSLQANVLLYRPPSPPTASETPKTLATNAGVFPWPSSQLDLTSDQSAVLAARTTKEMQRLSNSLTYVDWSKIYRAARRIIPKAVSHDEINAPMLADEVVRQNLRDKPEEALKLASNQVILFWTHVSNAVVALQKEARDSQNEASNLAAALPGELKPYDFPVFPLGPGNEEKERVRSQMTNAISRLTNAYTLDDNYKILSNEIGKAGLPASQAERFRDGINAIYNDVRRAQRAFAMAAALSNNAPEILFRPLPGDAELVSEGPTARREEFFHLMDFIRQGSFGGDDHASNPFGQARGIPVNPSSRDLAFSENSDRQRRLNDVGYLWRETCRPMTFQAVLNALMYTHENSYSAKTVKILQAAAVVAGGMVGLGTVIHEFRSDAYLESVSLVSTIFLPEVAKIVLEDLNKHIRNLGEMGMDTVVIVPPNEVVDRYIFFPKGPIYNFVDEFDVDIPGFIKRIDNDDVSVEATLIDAGVEVQAGGLSAAALSERALNEGQAEADSDLFKQSQLSDSLRSLQLKNLSSFIQTTLAGTNPGTNGTKDVKRSQAEAAVCARVRQYVSQWGADSSGVIATLLVNNGVDCDSSPPAVQLGAMPAPALLPGVKSKPYILPVSDVMGAWSLKLGVTSSDAAVLPATNVQIIMPNQGEQGAVKFAAQALTNSVANADVPVVLGFSATNVKAMVANFNLVATVHKPAFVFSIQGGASQSGSTFTLSDFNGKAFVYAILPIYDSDEASNPRWSYALQASDGSAQWEFTNEVTPTIATYAGVACQKSLLTVDGSQATNATVKLTLTVSDGTATFATTNIVFSRGVP